MNIEEARAHVGKFVMSRDVGNKLIPDRADKPENYHGPHLLVKVTKGGLCIFEDHNYYDIRVSPKLIRPMPPERPEDFSDEEYKEMLRLHYQFQGRIPVNPDYIRAARNSETVFLFNKDITDRMFPK